jgi:RimJ/RimL family protein N-acetyltransferase
MDATAGLPVPALNDDEVMLRGWSEKDVPAVVAACQDAEIRRWTRVPDPYTEADARAWFSTHPRMLASRQAIPLAIADSRTGELLGAIELRILPAGMGDIGYWVAPWARRRGVATRGLILLSRWGFDCLKLARMQVTTHPENRPSQRVAERAGFRREGVFRSYLDVKEVFSLLPNDR